MDVWSWLWVGWLGAFAAIEGTALLNSREGDTLSEHVWRWFGVGRNGEKRPEVTGWVRLRRFGLLAFMAWLSVHFVTGGFI
ncbi:hypothetical protein ABZY93_22150 [Streptomyces smyrnaeus]|uniref:hypothetical protein n=1 Tax=Streptomyces smyrnaeus TaxID=1387713 RepID=UPI0033B6E0F4